MRGKRNIYLGDIIAGQDEKLRYASLDVTVTFLVRHLTKHVDASLPEVEFRAWLDSDTDQPFDWNRVRYHWGCSP